MQTGAQILWECLLREGVEVVFGYPGAAVLPIYDALPRYAIRHVLSRHEQGAAHMADGYARASGRVGVALATSGPGATNLTTGIATAMRDSIPTVFITGQVSSPLLRTSAFQEVDMVSIARSITKDATLVTEARALAPTLRRAFATARSGRPGPVLVDICRDAQEAPAALDEPAHDIAVNAPRASAPTLACAAALIAKAQRPVILAGHGVLASGAARTLRAFAERTHTPVALTLLGLGGLPASHPLCLGMMGMHGQACANHAIQNADLLIACGMRFDDRVTGRLASYAPRARKIHIDIDPGEIGRKLAVDVGIVADLRGALEDLHEQVRPQRHPVWLRTIESWRHEARARDILSQPDDGRLHAPFVIDALARATRADAVIVTDVGQHQMWVAQYYPHERPRQLITSGGLGAMGFGLPAAIGAKIARPEAEVWLVVGDGGFQMTQGELATIVQEQVNVKIAVINNGFLGMVRQWQELFYDRRYTATPMLSPDFVTLARAYGLPALRVDQRHAVRSAIEEARATEGTTLVEFRVEPESVVYPMVPAGAGLHEMLRRPQAKIDRSAHPQPSV
jgi:acetolactate synthase I/II/III large subunit